VNVRAEGLRLIVGIAAAVIVSVTGMVLGVLVAPLAMIVTVAV
jgi:hypothetical protein